MLVPILTLQVTSKITRHTEEQSTIAMRAILDIKKLNALSLMTALAMSKLKLLPDTGYANEIIWQYLTRNNLRRSNRGKVTFLMRAS
jgi:hypothetical protein